MQSIKWIRIQVLVKTNKKAFKISLEKSINQSIGESMENMDNMKNMENMENMEKSMKSSQEIPGMPEVDSNNYKVDLNNYII